MAGKRSHVLQSVSELLVSSPATPQGDPAAQVRHLAAGESEAGRDRPLRIAIVSEVFLPAIDGVVTRLMRTLEELDRFGDEVLLVAPEGGPPEYRGVEVVGMPAVRMPLYPDGGSYPPKRVSPPTRRLDQVLARFEPDIVHAINPVLLGLSAASSARRRGIPLVASYHAHLATYAHSYRIGFMESLGWSYLRAVHNRAQLTLCTSLATGEQLVDHGFERVRLWPYGIDVERFNPGRASSAWRTRLSGGRNDRLVMLYVGRLAREKAVERLLEAAQVQGVTLAIVGDGPERAALEQAFAGTPTEFLGFLTGDDLADAYASADLFLLPSDTETLGLVTLEAQASGLPVIAADSPAARELVAQRRSGLLFDPASPGSLAAAVRELTADPERRAALSQRALDATQGCTWKAATAVLRRHYLECLQSVDSRPQSPARLPVSSSPALPAAAPSAPSPTSAALSLAAAAASALLLAAWLVGQLRAVEGISGLWLLNLLLSVPIAVVAVCIAALGATSGLQRLPQAAAAAIGRCVEILLGPAGLAAMIPPLVDPGPSALALAGWMRIVAGAMLLACAAAGAGALRQGRTATGRPPTTAMGRLAPTTTGRPGRAAAVRPGGERAADPAGG